jgi:hypothetical protein
MCVGESFCKIQYLLKNIVVQNDLPKVFESGIQKKVDDCFVKQSCRPLYKWSVNNIISPTPSTTTALIYCKTYPHLRLDRPASTARSTSIHSKTGIHLALDASAISARQSGIFSKTDLHIQQNALPSSATWTSI